jgi:hypothetical protein
VIGVGGFTRTCYKNLIFDSITVRTLKKKDRASLSYRYPLPVGAKGIGDLIRHELKA